MPIMRKTVHFAFITFAGLLLGVSLLGMIGTWVVERRTVDIALKGFGLVETAAGAADAGVARMDNLISVSRTEVREAAETITTTGRLPEANGPVFKALNERLETNLVPRIAQMQQALAP